jgi:hypothetical protein
MQVRKSDPGKARALLTTALDLHRKNSERHTSQINTELALSGVALESGDVKASEAFAHEALTLAETLRGDKLFSSWIGLVQLSLSTIAEAAGDIPTARQLSSATLAQLTPTPGENHDATKEVKARIASLR